MDSGYPTVAQPRPELAKQLRKWAWGITAFITIAVVAMQKIAIPLPEGMSLLWLPPVYSTLNALAGITLLFSLYFIKKGNVIRHKQANVIALAMSVLFILGYVAYHITNEPTRFGGEGFAKVFYLFLLASHVILAAVSLPLILFTFIAAYTGMIDKHRKLARWVYPIWLYVCFTGPVCYLMLRPYYPS
jgi:putative membrane protein